jgi:hypothetical protein
MRTRKWAAPEATLALTVAFGGDPTPCREAYLASHLNEQQMGLGKFRELYGDDGCATNGPSRQEAGAELVALEWDEGFERKDLT